MCSFILVLSFRCYVPSWKTSPPLLCGNTWLCAYAAGTEHRPRSLRLVVLSYQPDRQQRWAICQTRVLLLHCFSFHFLPLHRQVAAVFSLALCVTSSFPGPVTDLVKQRKRTKCQDCNTAVGCTVADFIFLHTKLWAFRSCFILACREQGVLCWVLPPGFFLISLLMRWKATKTPSQSF